MPALKRLSVLLLSSLLFGCFLKKGPNPDDPYESMNRKINDFNLVYDKAILKPLAKVYDALLPGVIKTGIDNWYNNLAMLPSIANDLLQADPKWALKDSWRFIMNSTLGLGGFFDVAKNAGLPPHFNDMGLTFAKWGDKKSAYLVIPLLGPSTFRDATGLTFDYSIFMPYPYLSNNALMYSLLGLRYVDLRAQMLDNEKLFEEAIDQYAFLRDAYLQHRNYLINGDSPQDDGELYVDDEDEADEALLNEGTDDGKKSLTPLTTSQNDSYRTLPARDSA